MSLQSIEEVDLLAVAQSLREHFGNSLSEGYLEGKTILRNAVAAILRCSDYEAEELVETMEGRGYLNFPSLQDATHSRRAAYWSILDHD